MKKDTVKTVDNSQDLQAQLEALRAENAQLKSKATHKKTEQSISFRISTKGAVSLYGLQKFPVTLYKSQWQRVLGVAADLATYLESVPDRAPEVPAETTTEIAG